MFGLFNIQAESIQSNYQEYDEINDESTEYNPFKKNHDLLVFEPNVLDSPTRDQIEADRIIEGLTGSKRNDLIDPFFNTQGIKAQSSRTNQRRGIFYQGQVQITGECKII